MPDSPVAVVMQVAFETDPLTRPGDLDWTTVTDAGDDSVLVRSLSTRRGARTVTGQIVPGNASAQVDYPGRVLEPFYDGSPWFPNVDLRKRVRWLVAPPFDAVEDISDGGDEDPEPDISDGGGADPPEANVSDGGGAGSAPTAIWTGFVRRWPNSWQMEVASTSVEAVGLLSLVAGVPLPLSVLHAEMTALEPDAWWPLSDSNQTRAVDLAGPNVGNYMLNPSSVNPGVVPWGSVPSVVLSPPTDSTAGQRVRITNLPWAANHQRTVAFWIRTPDLETNIDVPLWGQFEVSGTRKWRLTIEGGLLKHYLRTSSQGIEQVADYQFGNEVDAHLIVATVDATAEEFKLYIDGLPAVLLDNIEDGAPDYESLVEQFGPAVFGYDAAATALVGSNHATIHMGHAAIWDRTLTAAEVASLWDAGVFAWEGDTTGERLHRILDLAGVDMDDRDIDTGTQVCGPAVLAGQTLGSYIPKIAATEGGPIFELASGEIAMRERLANNPTPTFVLSDDPEGDAGTPYLSVAMDYSTDRLVNVASVTRVGSSVPVVVANEDSQSTYGTASQNLETLHGSSSGARSAGSRLVIRNSRPRLRIDAVTVSSVHLEEVDPAVSLGADVGDVSTFMARPPGGGDPVEQLLTVEAVEQRLSGGGEWTTSFGVFEHIVLPCFSWGTPGAGWGESAWCDQS